MNSTDLSNCHSPGEFGAKTVASEQDLAREIWQRNDCPEFDFHEDSSSLIGRHKTEDSRRETILSAPESCPSILHQERIDSSHFCLPSSVCPAPICRQFWKAGNYDERLTSKTACQNGTGYLHIHPKFLHSNATSHKWVLGAVAELIDNSVDEIQNGATFVVVDRILNPRDGSPALLIQDDGGGMGPKAMRCCLSFGFSDKKLPSAIGKYGNGFKTSSMRLGADVVVFSRCMNNRKMTQSVGLLSYSFLMQTGQDRIVVPMVDYHFDSQSSSWTTLQNEHNLNSNLSILLQWSPFTTVDELLKQCEKIGPHGTRVVVYNLWHGDEGQMELDFASDPEDIRVSGKGPSTAKVSSRKETSENHLANRLQYSLRAYLSILYMRIPGNFLILLRGRVVEYHNIANDLKYPQFILYKPQNVEGSVITTIGFLKEAPLVNIHGFNVYYKNRLILPFWRVLTYSCSRGRGVVGVLEANFIAPTHNKQDFERTPVLQKLETRLKDMSLEYWDHHCGLIGYPQPKKFRPATIPQAPQPEHHHSFYQPVELERSSFDVVHPTYNKVATYSSISLPSNQNSSGSPNKRKCQDNVVEPERVKRTGGSRKFPIVQGGDLQDAGDSAAEVEDHETASLMLENERLRAHCHEYEKTDKELNMKISRLMTELKVAEHLYTRLLKEQELLEQVKQEKGKFSTL